MKTTQPHRKIQKKIMQTSNKSFVPVETADTRPIAAREEDEVIDDRSHDWNRQDDFLTLRQFCGTDPVSQNNFQEEYAMPTKVLERLGPPDCSVALTEGGGTHTPLLLWKLSRVAAFLTAELGEGMARDFQFAHSEMRRLQTVRTEIMEEYQRLEDDWIQLEEGLSLIQTRGNCSEIKLRGVEDEIKRDFFAFMKMYRSRCRTFMKTERTLDTRHQCLEGDQNLLEEDLRRIRHQFRNTK